MCSTESALAPERRMGDSEVLEQSKLSQNDSQECFGVGGRFGANSAYVEDRSVVAERIWPCAWLIFFKQGLYITLPCLQCNLGVV